MRVYVGILVLYEIKSVFGSLVVKRAMEGKDAGASERASSSIKQKGLKALAWKQLVINPNPGLPSN